ARSKPKALPPANESIGTASCASSWVNATSNVAPLMTEQLGEAKVLGAQTASIPLLTTVGPEYSNWPDSVSVPAPNFVNPPPPSARACAIVTSLVSVSITAPPRSTVAPPAASKKSSALALACSVPPLKLNLPLPPVSAIWAAKRSPPFKSNIPVAPARRVSSTYPNTSTPAFKFQVPSPLSAIQVWDTVLVTEPPLWLTTPVLGVVATVIFPASP